MVLVLHQSIFQNAYQYKHRTTTTTMATRTSRRLGVTTILVQGLATEPTTATNVDRGRMISSSVLDHSSSSIPCHGLFLDTHRE